MILKMGGMDLHTYGMADKCMDRWMDVKMDGQIPPVFYRTSLPLHLDLGAEKNPK